MTSTDLLAGEIVSTGEHCMTSHVVEAAFAELVCKSFTPFSEHMIWSNKQDHPIYIHLISYAQDRCRVT